MVKRRVGFDVGGTFVDVAVTDGNRIWCHKTSSAPTSELADAVMRGVSGALRMAGAAGQAEHFAHGTTVATNTLIERRGASVGLVTTRGFRDVLEIGRMTRGDHFDVFVAKPRPLSPRAARAEVDERIAADGSVVVPLDESSVLRAIDDLVAHGVDSVAVSLINAYRNPEHELRVAELIAARHPQLTTTVSSYVSPEYGEFERTSTTVLNEYLRPAVTAYLDSVDERLRDIDAGAVLSVMQSNGGMVPAATAMCLPVRLLVSGPAAGVNGALVAARRTGCREFITMDMGGTSTDVSLVAGDGPSQSKETVVGGHPVRSVMSDIRSIGAGGGSLVRVDDSGSLHIGPESAGAKPGPMCYGHGGTTPTVTDADVVLGYLNPDRFCRGERALDVELARDGIQRAVAEPTKTSVTEAAEGIVELAVTNTAAAVRQVAAEKGSDPRDFTLVAFGGAGPLHACLVAEELEMRSVLVPCEPGLLSAVGLLVADARADAWRTYMSLVDDVDAAFLAAEITRLEQEAMALLQPALGTEVAFRHRAELCYRGQRHEFSIDLPAARAIDHDTIAWLKAELERRFRERYGFLPQDRREQLMTLRVAAVTTGAELAVDVPAVGGSSTGVAAPSYRDVYFPGRPDPQEVPVYWRPALAVGSTLSGPAIVEEDFATTVLSPGSEAIVLGTGDLQVEVPLSATARHESSGGARESATAMAGDA